MKTDGQLNYLSAASSAEVADKSADSLGTLLHRLVSDLNDLDISAGTDDLAPLRDLVSRFREAFYQSLKSEEITLYRIGLALRSAQSGDLGELREITKIAAAAV